MEGILGVVTADLYHEHGRLKQFGNTIYKTKTAVKNGMKKTKKHYMGTRCQAQKANTELKQSA